MAEINQKFDGGYEISFPGSMRGNADARCTQKGRTGIGTNHKPVIVRNFSDLIAVETNNRDARFGIKVNRSVTRLPVDVRLNSGTHLGFDLTHESES